MRKLGLVETSRRGKVFFLRKHKLYWSKMEVYVLSKGLEMTYRMVVTGSVVDLEKCYG